MSTSTSVHTYMLFCYCLQLLIHVSFATSWTAACQPPVSIGFPRQEYWSRLPFSTPGDLPGPGIKPKSLMSPALAVRFFTTAPLKNPGKEVNGGGRGQRRGK